VFKYMENKETRKTEIEKTSTEEGGRKERK
jgi:hypothetical protein